MVETIENLSEYLNCINSFQANASSDFIYYYRGHSKTSYKLEPSVFRIHDGIQELDREDFYFHEIRVRCPEVFQNCNHIEQLVRMQHYDCPTRLLDITTNPLIGLYFACKGKNTCETDPGLVYILRSTKNKVLYYDSDKVTMISCLAGLSIDVKNSIYDKCIEKLKSGKNKSRLFNARNNGINVERLYHKIQNENPAFEKNIAAVDLLQTYVVQPIRDNPRIIKQDGAFLLFGLNYGRTESSIEEEYDVKQVYIRNQKNILRELNSIGINEASLFPEVDKVACYLKSIRFGEEN